MVIECTLPVNQQFLTAVCRTYRLRNPSRKQEDELVSG